MNEQENSGSMASEESFGRGAEEAGVGLGSMDGPPRKRRWPYVLGLIALLLLLLVGAGELVRLLFPEHVPPLPYERAEGLFGADQFQLVLYGPQLSRNAEAPEGFEVAQGPKPVLPPVTPPEPPVTTKPLTPPEPPPSTTPEVPATKPLPPPEPPVTTKPVAPPEPPPSTTPEVPATKPLPPPEPPITTRPEPPITTDPKPPSTTPVPPPVKPEKPSKPPEASHGVSDRKLESPWHVGDPGNDLARTKPIERQDPDDKARQDPAPAPKPDYFKPENMVDGFRVVADGATSQLRWSLDRNDLYVNQFERSGSAGIEFAWPGTGHMQGVKGALPQDGSPAAAFWIKPLVEDNDYKRRFDKTGAEFNHWVGIEIPKDRLEEVSRQDPFEWRLVKPQTPPPGWGPVPSVAAMRKGADTRYFLMYMMPTVPLPKGVTAVELRLYHKPSQAYLAMDQHAVTIAQ